MIKHLIKTAAVCVLVMSAVPAMAEDTPLDMFNNELFDIVGEIKDADYSEGEILYEAIEYEMVVDENHDAVIDEATGSYLHDVYKDTLYVNGSHVKEYLFTCNAEYIVNFANRGYPVYSDGTAENQYVLTKMVEGGQDICLIDVQDGKITNEALIMEERYNEPGNYNSGYTVFKVTDVNGEAVRDIFYESASYDRFYMDIVCENEPEPEEDYNDGLKHSDEGYKLVDMNDEVRYESGEFMYYGYDYNLGYVMEWFDNGSSIDWSNPDIDPESRRIYRTYVRSVFTGDVYYFENLYINTFYDNGYTVVSTNNNGVLTEYVAKLKKPAVVTVFLDGEKILFDQLPIIENDRTLVPLRAIFEAIGAVVEWDGETKTVTASDGENEITLVIDRTDAVVNGQTVTLDVPAKVISGRTLVPVRFVADCFGVDTDWNGDLLQVLLTSK